MIKHPLLLCVFLLLTSCGGGGYYISLISADPLPDTTPSLAPTVATPAIAAGRLHTLVLKHDGTVWAWGWNASGQLGDGTTTNNTIPVRVEGLTDVISIATGYSHSIALKRDGTVWAWGNNIFGQLGIGTPTFHHSTPVQVKGLTGVTAIAAGHLHTLALKSDGTVWAWGLNASGQLGDCTTTKRVVPVRASDLTGVKAIVGGYSHSIALKKDGTLWAWGTNFWRQPEDENFFLSTSIPTQVNGLTGVKAMAAGRQHTIALKNDGTVWAWKTIPPGLSEERGHTSRTSLVRVKGLTNVTAIASGESLCLALKRDGTVWVWRVNTSGPWEVDSHARTGPVRVKGLTNVKAVAGGDTHSLALKSDGTVWAWGQNDFGQLGNGTTSKESRTPVKVRELTLSST